MGSALKKRRTRRSGWVRYNATCASRVIDTVLPKIHQAARVASRQSWAAMPHGLPARACRYSIMIEKQTLAADMIFWAVLTIPVVIFATAKIANYALKRAKRHRE
jgi:hypothetical protein